MARISRTNEDAADQQFLSGIAENAQSLTFLVYQGKLVTPADVVATLQRRGDSGRRVATAKAAWQAAVKSDHEERLQSRAFVSTIREAVKGAFAGAPDILAQYGLKARKPGAVSPEARVAAVAKAKATRAARHSMGAAQRAAIRGNVAGVVVTPTTGKEAPAPTPAPPTPPGVTIR